MHGRHPTALILRQISAAFLELTWRIEDGDGSSGTKQIYCPIPQAWPASFWFDWLTHTRIAALLAITSRARAMLALSRLFIRYIYASDHPLGLLFHHQREGAPHYGADCDSHTLVRLGIGIPAFHASPLRTSPPHHTLSQQPQFELSSSLYAGSDFSLASGSYVAHSCSRVCGLRRRALHPTRCGVLVTPPAGRAATHPSRPYLLQSRVPVRDGAKDGALANFNSQTSRGAHTSYSYERGMLPLRAPSHPPEAAPPFSVSPFAATARARGVELLPTSVWGAARSLRFVIVHAPCAFCTVRVHAHSGDHSSLTVLLLAVSGYRLRSMQQPCRLPSPASVRDYADDVRANGRTAPLTCHGAHTRASAATAAAPTFHSHVPSSGVVRTYKLRRSSSSSHRAMSEGDDPECYVCAGRAPRPRAVCRLRPKKARELRRRLRVHRALSSSGDPQHPMRDPHPDRVSPRGLLPHRMRPFAAVAPTATGARAQELSLHHERALLRQEVSPRRPHPGSSSELLSLVFRCAYGHSISPTANSSHSRSTSYNLLVHMSPPRAASPIARGGVGGAREALPAFVCPGRALRCCARSRRSRERSGYDIGEARCSAASATAVGSAPVTSDSLSAGTFCATPRGDYRSVGAILLRASYSETPAVPSNDTRAAFRMRLLHAPVGRPPLPALWRPLRLSFRRHIVLSTNKLPALINKHWRCTKFTQLLPYLALATMVLALILGVAVRRGSAASQLRALLIPQIFTAPATSFQAPLPIHFL
ncbi:hypothetical protein FB451DRAFT_1516667 [Mycena latifolia]|nr:hypothetical protein FB451DRAFT_1516667 [Mycena latifolia]